MFGYRSRRRSSAGKTRRSVPTRRSTRKPSFLTKTTPSKKTKPTRSLGVVKLGKAVAKTTPSKRTKPINERPTRSMRTQRGQLKRLENLQKRALRKAGIFLTPAAERRSNKNLLSKQKIK